MNIDNIGSANTLKLVVPLKTFHNYTLIRNLRMPLTYYNMVTLYHHTPMELDILSINIIFIVILLLTPQSVGGGLP